MNRTFDVKFIDAYTTKIVFGSKNRVIVVKAFEEKAINGPSYPSTSAFHVYFYSPSEDVSIHGIINKSHYGLLNHVFSLYQGMLDTYGDRFNNIRYYWFILVKRCITSYPNFPISKDEMSNFINSLEL